MREEAAYEVPTDRGLQWTWRYGIVVTRHPRFFILIPAILCILASVGLFNLKSTPDSRIFFSDDNPQLRFNSFSTCRRYNF